MEIEKPYCFDQVRQKSQVQERFLKQFR